METLRWFRASNVRRVIAFLLALVLFGLLKWPMEVNLDQEQKLAGLRKGTVDLAMRQRLGQEAFIAALSGFRSMVATFQWLSMTDAWSRVEWGRVANLVNLVTTLQPRNTRFWDEGAWQMGWNAATNVRNNKSLREAQREHGYRKYLEQAETILKRGISNNPDTWRLYFALGNLYRDRFGDHCRAAEAYEKAAVFPDVPSYVKRFVAYEYAQCPGQEKRAYEILKGLYLRGEAERLPTLLTRLKEMEEKLQIPQEQRVYKPE